MAQLNDRIRKLRKEKKLTQKTLGAQIGVNEAQIRTWEIYDIWISTPYIIKLSKVLDVSTDYLLGLTDDKTFGRCAQRGLPDYSTDELMKEVLRRWL